jgi:hypothetical protein
MARIFPAAAAAALTFLSLAAPANAQFLTYVSATGNDANTCFVQTSPCKTLQRGINQTSAGGELRLLSNLSGNGLVNKSITIDGGANTVIGSIAVNSASAIVALRRLDLDGRHAFATGLNIVTATAVHVEHCTIERYTGDGIKLAAGAATELSVSDSTVADNGSDGIDVTTGSTAKLMIADSVLANNSVNGLQLFGGFAAIVRSTVSGSNGAGLFVVGATLVARDTTLASSAENLNVGSGGVATLKSVTLRDASAGASSIFVGSGGLVRLANSVLTNNAVAIDNGGVVQTLEDNILDGNGSDVSGTALDTATVNYQ